MRKIIVVSMVTLDGVIQAPGGPSEDPSGGFKYGGWTFPYVDEYFGNVMAEEMSQAFDLLLGRKTFEIFASYWPQHVEEGPGPGINRATKYIVSLTRASDEWEKSVFISGNVVNEIRKLKAGDGPDLQVHGSGELVQTLLQYDLVDEFWLRIFPVMLGVGKRLFDKGTVPAAYTLVDAKTSPGGVIFATLKRAGEVQTGSF